MATGGDDPLKREAEKRAEWRGDERAVPHESGGHRVPGGEDEDEEAQDVRTGAGGLGVAPPPD